MDGWTTFLMIECYDKCDNVLDAHNVNVLIQAEKALIAHTDYKHFCLANTESAECSEDATRSFTGLFTEE